MEQYNILIVEDDKEIRDGIEIFLKSQNYNVYKAADGIEGLEIIESKDTLVDLRGKYITITASPLFYK